MDKTPRSFHRLSTKLIAGTICILLLILGVSLYMNSKVIHRVYLHRQTAYVRHVGETLVQQLAAGVPPTEVIKTIEAAEKVLIVLAPDTADADRLNEELRDRFRQKGLGFQKLWLWEQDYASAVQYGRQLRLYHQDKLNYGILVEYLTIGSDLCAIALIVPDAQEFMDLINRSSVLLYACSLILAVVLIWFFVKRITNPLHKIEQFSKEISRQQYGLLSIHTHDELETVADSMNQMSRDIKHYQQILLDKNRQMELLLDNVAHDLKTPIALIGMYSAGIRDQIDDGTFLDTIISQNTRMAQLVEKLLDLSRIGQKEHVSSPADLDQILRSQIESFRVMAVRRGLELHASIVPHAVIHGNPELIESLFANLLSNAVKYAADKNVDILLKKQEDRYLFTVSNAVQHEALDLSRIWEPFYVGEPSRNTDLSGTGIGLAIVHRIAEQEGYQVDCLMEGGRIQFVVVFSHSL